MHPIRRLGQVECLDCGLVREPAPVLVPAPAGGHDAEMAAALARPPAAPRLGAESGGGATRR